LTKETKPSISSVRFSELEGSRRLDAEYYQPHYLAAAEKLQRCGRVGEIIECALHPAEIKREYSETGLQLLLAQNVRRNYLDFSTTVFLPETVADLLRKNRLHPGDVVVVRTGANAGDTSCYDGEPERLYASAHLILVRPKGIEGAYLSTYFNTEIGRQLIKRGVYGSSQPEIAPAYVETLPVPRSDTVEREVVELVNQAREAERKSKCLYRQAEQLFLDESGLSDQDLSDDLWNDAKLTAVLGKSRLDAEHYQAKYHQLETAIVLYGSSTIGELLEGPPVKGQQQDGEPYQDGYAPYVSIKDIYDYALVPNQYISLGGAPPACAQPNDLLLALTGATLGKVGINFDIPALYYSGDLLRLRFKGIDPLYIAAFLRSPIGQDLIWRYQTGSTNRHLAPDDVVKIPVPRLQPTQEGAIANQVRESYATRVKCTQILEQAKRKVEAMIESEAVHG